MNATQLKSRAARLMARLTAMGFTKAGKPMVIDQAFELVAAEEGYRNQHALRASLPKETGIDAAMAIFARGVASTGYRMSSDPVAVDQAEDAGLLQWHAACNRAAWNDEAQILQLEGFIAQKGLMSEFGAYAHAAALEEAPVPVTKRLVTEEQIAFLRAVGYEICESEYKLPYWELEWDQGDAASEDFNTIDEVWADAWRDAVQRQFIAPAAEHSPIMLQAATLEATWGDEHGHYSREDWGQALALRNTKLGLYWEWVAQCIETNGGNEAHCENCGVPLDDGGCDEKCSICTNQSNAVQAADIAQVAYETFDFQAALGSNFTVAARNGWEYTSGSPQVSCTVFVENAEAPAEPTSKVRFTVEVIGGVASNPRVTS